jgi:DMSO/TMAO reductase YedYZ molybdopterin-dependent catalytic subunit
MSRRISPFRGVAAALLVMTLAFVSPVAAAAPATPVGTPGAGAAIEIRGLVGRPGPITIAELQALPVRTVEASFQTIDGAEERHHYRGVRLYDLLQHVGVMAEPGDRTPLLRRYLVVTAHDGYRVVLAGGEIDLDFGNADILLAWEQDGAPLTGKQGPLELVVPGDRLSSRYVWGVVDIDVLGIESAPEE